MKNYYASPSRDALQNWCNASNIQDRAVAKQQLVSAIVHEPTLFTDLAKSNQREKALKHLSVNTTINKHIKLNGG